MRNCYVYKCDRQHKDDPKRTMFNVPKDPQKFEEWRQVLPKHRPLQPHDRVCEKHFKSTDIQRDWTYQIEGKTKKLMRTKPVLRPDAIPCIFNVLKPDVGSVTTGKRRRKKSPERSEANVIVVVESTTSQLVEEPVDPEQSVVILMEEGELMDVNKPDVAAPSENGVVELHGVDMDVGEKESIFEELYDNIFEVELPSTLWGVHREPAREFVAFSRCGWNQKDGNAIRTVSLLIDCALKCRAWYGGKLAFGSDLATLLASIRSDEQGNSARLNMTIVKLLDKLEQYAAKEALVDVVKIKEALEECLRCESVRACSKKVSLNDEASSVGLESNKDQA